MHILGERGEEGKGEGRVCSVEGGGEGGGCNSSYGSNHSVD